MKEKELFKYDYKINYDEFKNLILLNPKGIFQKYILNASLIFSIIILFFSIINGYNVENTLLYICLLIVIIVFTSRIVILFFARIGFFYLKVRKKIKYNSIKFYKDYLILDNGISEFKIKNIQVSNIIETNNNLYLCSGMIIPIIKKNLSKEKIEFIRNINQSNYINNVKNNKVNMGDN